MVYFRNSKKFRMIGVRGYVQEEQIGEGDRGYIIGVLEFIWKVLVVIENFKVGSVMYRYFFFQKDY